MHIPDAYLSPATEAAAFCVMLPVWAFAARKTKDELSSRQTPLLSVGSAFCFAIQMFNIPAVGGTTSHALGSVLLAILVGPWAAVLGMTLTLAVQALLFGDGGVLSLGANCFNMALVASLCGYGAYRLFVGKLDLGSPRGLISAAAGAYIGTAAASLSASIMLGIQPLVAHDGLGQALYCPFGLGITIPAMLMSHLAVAAPAEAIITIAALSYLLRAFPDLITPAAKPRPHVGSRLARSLVWLLVLTPLGLLASGTAFGEWGTEDLQRIVGYAPKGMARVHEIVRPLMPGYGFAGPSGTAWSIIGYIASALVGCGAVALFTRGLLRKGKPQLRGFAPLKSEQKSFPDWLMAKSVPVPAATRIRGAWMDKTVHSMQAMLARAIVSEEIAGSPGLLQAIRPSAKAIGFLGALVATALTRSPYILIGLLLVAALAAALSRVPLKSFGIRVFGAVAFFGLVVAIPLTLASVTPGSVAFRAFGVDISSPGLQLALAMLLRLGTGITLALLWSLTTPWHSLLGSLSSLGVPHPLISAAALMYRYLFLLIETLGEMLQARTARLVGSCAKNEARTYWGAVTAVLFSKSLMLTEETHLAMVARGYDGKVRKNLLPRWQLLDFATALLGGFFLATVVLQGTFHAF